MRPIPTPPRPPARSPTGLPLASSVLALLLAAGCGGGGGALPGAGSEGSGGTGAGPGEGGPGAEVTVPAGTRTDRLLVRMLDPAGLASLLQETGASLLRPVPGTSWLLIEVPPGSTALAFLSQLEADLRVAAAALDLGLSSPEGDGSTLPAGGFLLSADLPHQPELVRIGAPAARTRTRGAGVRVAVIDTGILPEHEAVAGRVEPDGYDFLDDDPDPREEADGLDTDGDGLVDEVHGHGTFVASLILAVAPDARIVPLRVLDADGVGTSSAVATAIVYAAERAVAVVNLSVHVPTEVEVVREAIEHARLLGVQVIASAGNTGEAHTGLASSALLVTAVDEEDVRAAFATWGEAVGLSAPGVDLHGAHPDSPGTAIWSGTSFSAALATGGLALRRAQRPLWTSEQVLDRLRQTAVPIDAWNPAHAGMLGAGRVDLDAATAP